MATAVGVATHAEQIAPIAAPTAAPSGPHADCTHGIAAACMAGPWEQWQGKSMGTVQPTLLAASMMQGIPQAGIRDVAAQGGPVGDGAPEGGAVTTWDQTGATRAKAVRKRLTVCILDIDGGRVDSE